MQCQWSLHRSGHVPVHGDMGGAELHRSESSLLPFLLARLLCPYDGQHGPVDTLHTVNVPPAPAGVNFNISAEYQRQKKKSMFKACRITVQKFLYGITSVRPFYFDDCGHFFGFLKLSRLIIYRSRVCGGGCSSR